MIDNTNDLEEIWSVFGEESKENLDLIEDHLLKLETSPDDSFLIAALFRSMHTVKGGARMMGLVTMERLAHSAEDLVSLVRDEGVPMDSAMNHELLEVLDRLRGLLDGVLSCRCDAEFDQVADLTAAVEAMIADRRGMVSLSSGQGVVEETLIQTTKQSEQPEEEAGLLSLESGLTTDVEAGRIELIDLSADPVSVRIFFEMAEDSIKRIQLGLERFGDLCEAEELEGIHSAAGSLEYAANQMGYHAMEKVLEDFQTTILDLQHASLQDSVEYDRLVKCLCSLAHALDTEMETLQQRYATLEPTSTVPLLQTAAVETAEGETPAVPLAYTEVLQNFFQIVGEMTGDQTTIHHLIRDLAQTDLIGDVLKLLNQHQRETQETTGELQLYLNHWMDRVAALVQVESKVSASLNRLQEMSSELGITLERTIVEGMVVRVNQVYYLIPIHFIRRIAAASAERTVSASVDGRQILFQTEDQLLPGCRLSAEIAEEETDGLVVVIDSQTRSFALHVDALVGQQRALVLPLKGEMRNIRNVSGHFLMGDGTIGMVLNPDLVAASL